MSKTEIPSIRFRGFDNDWGPVKIYAQNCLQAPAE